MGKSVLLVAGSPRRGGNSNLLAESFMHGARAAGHDVARFDAAADPVHPCRACDACWNKGKPCAFDDGFDRLAPMLEKADAVALCGPVYFAGFSAQLKAALDKLHAYTMPRAPRKLAGKRGLLLMCAANPSPAMFTAPERAFVDCLAFLGWTDGGRLLVPGVYAMGAVKETDALARAERIGREL